MLDVTPYELLSGAEDEGNRSKRADYYIIEKKSETGILIENMQSLSKKDRGRLMGYVEALRDNE